MRRAGLIAAATAAWMALAPVAFGQDQTAPAEPEAPAQASGDAPKDVSKRKPRPKPRPKPQAKPVNKPAEAPPAGSPPSTSPTPAALPSPSASPSPAPPPAATRFAAPPVVCEPDQAVRYDGAKAMDLWVTRSGAITLDNPLRPLTPDVTRVLQVVVGGKVATAYGPDLLSLRRGGSPATLEGTIGGKILWDASLVALPDSLPINAETGEPLAELRFRECGTAPSAKLLPPPKARRTAPTAEALAAEAEKAEKAAAKAKAKPARPKSASQPPAATTGDLPRHPGLQLPQGAIP
ncbi:MAG TPA: hypothetical protein K8W01_12275 [Methylorubrum populi]|uniref:Uncharacterized protein n=1 Tax=Methylorubrum populi TaxID=223967 RepID=A0A921JF22_9HYPH|nr:hypothetical protein [Methylorubrum populi]